MQIDTWNYLEPLKDAKPVLSLYINVYDVLTPPTYELTTSG